MSEVLSLEDRTGELLMEEGFWPELELPEVTVTPERDYFVASMQGYPELAGEGFTEEDAIKDLLQRLPCTMTEFTIH